MYLSKKDISEWIASLKVGDEVAIQITRMDGVIVSSERGIVDKWLGKRLIVVNGKHFVPSTGLRQSNALSLVKRQSWNNFSPWMLCF